MITINIKEDFSSKTGFRTYDDGPFSGQEFFDNLLKPKFKEALTNKVLLKVILDGGEGYTSSFLNEAFRLLGKEYGPHIVKDKLNIISLEWPKYINKINNSIYEMAE